MSLLLDFGIAFYSVLSESAPFVVLGFLIAGLLHEFVPAAALKRGVGGRSLAPVLRAVGVGAMLPICSCSTIPLGIGLTRSGASTGTALAFMTSSPAISPVTLMLGWAVLGPALLGWYAAIAVGGAVLIGVVGNRLLSRVRPAESEVKKPCGCGCGTTPSNSSRLVRAMRWSFGELGVEVSQSLFVGLAVAALVLTLMPSGLVEGWLGQPSWLAMLAAVAIAIPAYTCSVPSLVIAGSLIARGVDPSVAVVFLFAGPATNLGELNAIRAAMGAKAAGFYAGMLITIALVAGAATSLIPLPTAPIVASHAGHSHTHALDTAVLGAQTGPLGVEQLAQIPAWRLPFVALIVVLAAVSLIRYWRSRPQTAAAESSDSSQPLPNLYSITTS